MKSVIVVFILVLIACFSNGKEYKVQTVDLQEISAPPHRVIGGESTSIERWPFAVQLLRHMSVYCGGVLLTTRHVLSAAHCLVTGTEVDPAAWYHILAGATRRSGHLLAEGQLVQVSEIIIHEQYDVPTNLNNDVAVMLMARDVTLSASVGLAAIPSPVGYELPDGAPLTYIGWGLTGSVVAAVLQQVGVYKVNWQLCEQRYLELNQTKPAGWNYFVTDVMICAGIIDVGGRDACGGDSGGPLLYDSSVVVGIISWGEGCAEALYPGVNARVTNFTNWIVNSVERLTVVDGVGGTNTTNITIVTTTTTTQAPTTSAPGNGVTFHANAFVIFTLALLLSLQLIIHNCNL